MKIERINKSHKKEIIVGGLILVSIVSAITLVTTKSKYRVTENIKLVNGTINYKPYDFKIMAMYQQNDSGAYTEINEMPTSGYVVNEEKSYCTTDNKTQVKGKIKTENGKHNISDLTKSDKCYVWFDKKKIENANDLISSVISKDTTPDFAQLATSDEGVFKEPDGMYGGYSYYWRGAATTNHIIFANKCWRIVRINGDGTIRMIYNGTIKSGNTCIGNGIEENGQYGSVKSDSIAVKNQAYSTNYNAAYYVGWTYTYMSQRPTDNATATVSNAKNITDGWYNSNIGNSGTYASRVIDGKFCNDRDIKSGDTWNSSSTSGSFYYAASKRIYNDYVPTLSCNSSDIYILKAGAITADEVMYAGWTPNKSNMSFYLYNGEDYWTMTPYWWNGSHGHTQVLAMQNNGYINDRDVDTSTNIGIRPVINLRSNVIFSSGNGTQNSPFVVQ